ncbi:macrophage expressed protein [Elysia marginata]|uniref:Macrophage expressed protein n=1 Tax=Elysia marginata TaxID=1093978 RepID=A0AAV4FKE6_9GAST|nr:macrophage expressed protein [Elysia marginata]
MIIDASTLCMVTAVSWVLFVNGKFSDASDTYPFGDPRRCLSNVDKGVNILEVLPGSGWDNLQNTETGMVLAHNFSKCRMTEDQRYIIPDSILVFILKTYLWQAKADEVYSSKSGLSVTARGINVDSHYDGEYDISGLFCAEKRDVGTKNNEDVSITKRVQRRYVGYRAVMQPDMPLSSRFRLRLRTIAEYVHAGQVRQARYASQQLVREFGTHVISGVEAGTVWIQDDSISNEVLNISSQAKPSASISPSLSITTNISNVQLNVSDHTRTQLRTNTSTINNSTVSWMRSFGGSPVAHPNMSEEEWVQSFSNNLVAVDRTGEPLDSLVQAETLPELPPDTVLQLNSLVKEAIQTYYKINTYPGCTDINAANYSPQANADDGSCQKLGQHQTRNTTIRFGGVYQTCNASGDYDSSRDLCSGLRQINPSTGFTSCPAGYETIPLHRNIVQHSQTVQTCEPCWMGIFKCCQDVVKLATVESDAFWCSYVSYNISKKHDLDDPFKENDVEFDEPEEPTFPGFLFGGTFTSKVPNLLTSAKTCPRGFLPLSVGEDISICVSDGGHEATSQAVKFAGFFSCSAGNPLSVRYTTLNSPLLLHTYSRGPTAWPKQCPSGYSPYMTAIMMEDGCEIYHCIQPRTGSRSTPHKLRRPPFAPATSVKGPMQIKNTLLLKTEHPERKSPHVEEQERKPINIQAPRSGYIHPDDVQNQKTGNTVLILTLDSSNIVTVIAYLGLSVSLLLIMFFVSAKLKKRRAHEQSINQHYSELYAKS